MKKKIVAAALAVLSLITVVLMDTHYAQAVELVTVIIDGQTINFPDAPAYMDENGRTQIPVRCLSESLGAHVAWDEAAERVTVSRQSSLWEKTIFDGKYLDFYIGSNIYYTRIGREGQNTRHEMDTSAVIEQGRTYLPIRFVAEALDAKVDWDPETLTVKITSETKSVGKFIVPKSFTDNASRSDVVSVTIFYIYSLECFSGGASFENRTKTTLNVLSQVIGQDTINWLDRLIKGDKAFASKDSYGNKYEIKLDSESGQYVLLTTYQNIYRIAIYDKGVLPEI